MILPCLTIYIFVYGTSNYSTVTLIINSEIHTGCLGYKLVLFYSSAAMCICLICDYNYIYIYLYGEPNFSIAYLVEIGYLPHFFLVLGALLAVCIFLVVLGFSQQHI